MAINRSQWLLCCHPFGRTWAWSLPGGVLPISRRPKACLVSGSRLPVFRQFPAATRDVREQIASPSCAAPPPSRALSLRTMAWTRAEYNRSPPIINSASAMIQQPTLGYLEPWVLQKRKRGHWHRKMKEYRWVQSISLICLKNNGLSQLLHARFCVMTPLLYMGEFISLQIPWRQLSKKAHPLGDTVQFRRTWAYQRSMQSFYFQE